MTPIAALERDLLAAIRREDWPEAERIGDLLDEHEASLSAPGALAGAATWYAQSGIAVFPCRPGGKAPLTRHGFQDATCDVEQVRAWWAATPAANIGLPTGRRFDVIDTDGPTGCASFGLADLHETGHDVLAWASTPHGFHYLIAPTGEGNRAGMLPGVDYRGAGGYVLAAPSRITCERAADDCYNRSSHAYRWVQPIDPARLPVEAAS